MPVKILAFILACAAMAAAEPARPRAVVAGFVEEIFISGSGKPVRFEAKLDTGATTSALNTDGDTEEFTRDQQRWIRFVIKNDEGTKLNVEAPILRTTIIRRAGAAPDRRAVIRLPACVAGLRKTEEFTLTDRSGMDYPVLLGRNFLASDILVDSGRTSLTTGKCRE